MKINANKFRKQLLAVSREDALSIEEIANLSGIHFVTLYRIVNNKDENSTVQLATIRKIAEGTKRKFKITDDDVVFYVEQKKESEQPGLSPTFQQLLDNVKHLSVEEQEGVAKMFLEILSWGKIREPLGEGKLKKN